MKNYTFIYYVSTQRNLKFLVISDTVYLAFLYRHQFAAHHCGKIILLLGDLGGVGGFTAVGCRYFQNLTVSLIFEARENTLKSSVAVHGHLKH